MSTSSQRPPAEPDLRTATARLFAEEAALREGGGPEATRRQHEKGRKTARERISGLIDPGTDLFELGLWAAHGMYEDRLINSPEHA